MPYRIYGTGTTPGGSTYVRTTVVEDMRSTWLCFYDASRWRKKMARQFPYMNYEIEWSER